MCYQDQEFPRDRQKDFQSEPDSASIDHEFPDKSVQCTKFEVSFHKKQEEEKYVAHF